MGAVAAATVLLAAPASSAGPAGFREAVKLEPAASFVAGKRVKVWCALTVVAFHARGAAYEDSDGFVDAPGTNDEFLSPRACAYLVAWLSGKRVEPYAFAVASLTLTHESEHLRGLTDESETDCAALRVMPATIRRFFPTLGRATVHDLMAYAWDAHERHPAVYQGAC